MKHNNKKSFILLLSLLLMTALTVLVAALLFMVTYETRDVGAQRDDVILLNLAEAGVQQAQRVLRDDVLTTSQTGVAELRGNTASGTGGSQSQLNTVRYYNEGDVLTLDAKGATGTTVILQNFDINYLNTTIKNVKIGCCYSKSASGGTTPTLEVLYTTNGSFPQSGNSSFSTSVTSTSYNTSPFIVLDITSDRSWTWELINNVNFQICARAYNAANRNVLIDYFFIQVTYEIDTLTEAWATGSYTAFPISLGGGNISSISMAAQQGKVHLNTASQLLLNNLMIECGIPGATAATLAVNIVTFRATTPFDSIEQLQQVSGMTLAYYNMIKDFVTVYSFINTSATRPTGSRAPININTAPREVLEAIFDPLGLGASDPASLAADIITFRTANPFTCFYNSGSTTDFYDFVNNLAYLTAAEKNIVLDNADASTLSPVYGYAGSNVVTTEFCYDSNNYKIDSLARLKGRSFRIKTILGNDGARSDYRKENFE